MENAFLLFGRQGTRELLGAQELAEPLPLHFRGKMCDLDAERSRVTKPEPPNDIACGRHVKTEHIPGDFLQVGIGDSVELWRELGSSEWRRPQRINRDV